MEVKSYKDLLKDLYQKTVKLRNPKEASELICNNKALVFDIRSKEEFQVSHLSGAHFQDYQTFNPQLKEVPQDHIIIVYCTVGYRSEKAGEQLIQQGYQNVINLYGGIFQWVNEGYLVVGNDGEPTKNVHTYNKKWAQWLTAGNGIN